MATLGHPLLFFKVHTDDPEYIIKNKFAQRALDLLISANKVISWPVADGYAYYFVQSVSPPVLSHIPIGDAYRVAPETIRGIRAQDIEKYLELMKFQYNFDSSKTK